MTGLFTGFAQLDFTCSSDDKATYSKVTQLNFNIILFPHSAALIGFLPVTTFFFLFLQILRNFLCLRTDFLFFRILIERRLELVLQLFITFWRRLKWNAVLTPCNGIRIRNPQMWNLEYRLKNWTSINDWNPEAKFHWSWNPVPGNRLQKHRENRLRLLNYLKTPPPSPPLPCPPDISIFFFALDGKFPGVGTLELSNPPGWGRKKRANAPSSINTATFFIDRAVE